MAFENIDVNSLKNSLNLCNNSLNNNTSTNLMSSVNNDNVWISNSRTKFRSGLQSINESYEKLKSEISQYLQVAGDIEKYKGLESENIQLQQKYNSLEPNLYYKVEHTDKTYDDVTDTWEEDTWYETVKDLQVEAEMNQIASTIQQNKEKMLIIETQVKNAVL